MKEWICPECGERHSDDEIECLFIHAKQYRAKSNELERKIFELLEKRMGNARRPD